jgi:hypothetical protein
MSDHVPRRVSEEQPEPGASDQQSNVPVPWNDGLTPEQRLWVGVSADISASLMQRPPGRGMAGVLAALLVNGAHPDGGRLMFETYSAPFRDPASGPLVPDWDELLERGRRSLPGFAAELPGLLAAASGRRFQKTCISIAATRLARSAERLKAPIRRPRDRSTTARISNREQSGLDRSPSVSVAHRVVLA